MDHGGVGSLIQPRRVLWPPYRLHRKRCSLSGRRHVSEGALMLPWVQVFLPFFQPSINRVHGIPPLLSRQLDLCSTIATRSRPALALLPQLHVFSHPVVRLQLESTDSFGRRPKFRHDLEGRRPTKRLVPSSTRPCNQNVAERRYLPRVVHCGIHVVLPIDPWIAALGSTWAPIPTTSTLCGTKALFLNTYACIW